MESKSHAQECKVLNLFYLLLTSIELNPSVASRIGVLDTAFVTFPMVEDSDSDDSLANVNGVGIFRTKFVSLGRSWS